jgi:raffinose/stachyose/melibiose transport system permease protein
VAVAWVWRLMLGNTWGIAPMFLDAVGLRGLYAPWLGKEEYALTALAPDLGLAVRGIPMMLIYAALLSIPDEVLEAAEMDGSPAGRVPARAAPLILPRSGSSRS